LGFRACGELTDDHPIAENVNENRVQTFEAAGHAGDTTDAATVLCSTVSG
jgi:uncharacterized protein YsxB (DUF464 family)